MSLFNQLNEAAAQHGLRFLVIGGHAVIEHGFQRGTEDADILVCKDDRDRWQEVVLQLGYKLFHDGGTFVQYEPSDGAQWNLDLMLVPAETFDRLVSAAKPANLEGAAVVVPSLEHLLTLKVHALKHAPSLRALKDLTDVAQLVSVNRVDPKAAWLRALFEKHGTPELYERVIKLLS
ncbi:MAG: nucleotidyltransferase family protein [Verrucomicrobia bacterium]|nr:nucleotidyltransferase family protein [Verrucomicrobiota bacterium]